LTINTSKSIECRNKIFTIVKNILIRNCSQGNILLKDDLFMSNILNNIVSDLKCFVKKDPAAHQDMKYVLESYSSFKAVMHYRIANQLYYNNQDFKYSSRQISEHAKCKYRIDIHPAAKIGKNFIIDHGFGTIIGETCTIGDNCYILQEVILGAKGIAGNKNEKRHPTIGNFVEIGASAKILGSVKIGNHVTIAPNSIITQNVPSHSKVTICNQLQIERNKTGIQIYGIYPHNTYGSNHLCIRGEKLSGAVIRMRDENLRMIPGIKIKIIDETNEHIVFKVLIDSFIKKENTKINISIEEKNYIKAILTNSLALDNLLYSPNYSQNQIISNDVLTYPSHVSVGMFTPTAISHNEI
jgi:serine O-acetyltransferase